MKIVYTPRFVKKLNKLPEALQVEALEKIELFSSEQEHPFLKTHKLKGRLRGYWSFSVNYSYRVIFEYDAKDVIALLDIGDHSVYD